MTSETIERTPPRAAEAAPGVARSDAKAVNARKQRDLYASRVKVYPKLGSGKFRTIKWIFMIVSLGIYYGLPWIRWDRGPGHPNQAILLDFAHTRLYFGPLEIWPQELYLITGVLVISALALFLVTALAGRVWCGYACPQTVWTDLMIAVERFWQGDRNARIRLDASPMSFNKLWRKTATHISWLLIGLATGGVLVFYFRDAPTLVQELLTGTAPTVALVFIFIFTAFTYLLGGIAREQVCIYMCPWPRIQGAMFDADSYLVSYHGVRGEPRGPHKKNDPWEGRGDCIDCAQCVAVCPVGIDIRDGAQLECIQCALCIDACNAIMKKVNRPPLLIAYDTFHNIDAATTGHSKRTRILRPRTVLYGLMILLVSAITLFALFNRSIVTVTVQADRNPLFVVLSDGSVRNGFTVKIENKQAGAHHFKVSVDGLPNAGLSTAGSDATGDQLVDVDAGTLKAIKLYVKVPPGDARNLASDTAPFDVVVTDTGDNSVTRHRTSFRRPTP